MWRIAFLLIMGVVPGVWAHGEGGFEHYPQLDYFNSGLRAADDPDDIAMQLVITNPKTAHTLMLYGIECEQAKNARIERVRTLLGETMYEEKTSFRLEPGVTVDLSPPKYRIVLEDVKASENGRVDIFVLFGEPIGKIGLRIPYPDKVMELNSNREETPVTQSDK